MKIITRLLITTAPLFFIGCVSKNNQNPADANLFSDQENLVKLIQSSKINDKDRMLVHLSHTCDLHIDGKSFRVLDMRELVKGAQSPRGVNQIILLNPAHQLVNRIEYGSARPLFCKDDRLYLYDDLIPDGQSESGNVLKFSDQGFTVTPAHEDLNSLIP